MARRRNGLKSIQDIRDQKRRIIAMARQRGAYKQGSLSKDAATAQKHADKAKAIADRFEKNINRQLYGVDEPLEWAEELDAERYVRNLNKRIARTIYAAKAVGGQG